MTVSRGLPLGGSLLTSATVGASVGAIPTDSGVILPSAGSTVAARAGDDGLLHGAVRSEVLEEPRFEAAGLEVTVRDERVGGRPVGDVVDGEIRIGVVG